MKRFLFPIIASALYPAILLPADHIIIQPQWIELDSKASQFKSRWILIGDVIFNKRSKESAAIQKLVLRWKGSQVNDLLGSLYQKLGNKFLPIEDNLICDGHWNKTKQELSFKFNKPKNLRTTNTFCIVLTLSPMLIKQLHKGHFEVATDYLPITFKTALNNSLALPIHA